MSYETPEKRYVYIVRAYFGVWETESQIYGVYDSPRKSEERIIDLEEEAYYRHHHFYTEVMEVM